MNSCLYNLRHPSHPYYQDLVNELTDWLGIHRIEVYESDTPNACATLIKHDGYDTPVISLNPSFVGQLWRVSEWAVISVLAHEVAHHYNLDLRRKKSLAWLGDPISHQKELNADRFAGNVLRCKGATFDEAHDMYRAIPMKESRTHPGMPARVRAMRAGWNEAYCAVSPRRRVVRSSNVARNNNVLLALSALVVLGLLTSN